MSEYKCEACGKYKTPDNSGLKVGDKVNFAIVTQPSRQTMRISSKDGEVTEVDGDILTIKVKRGGTYKLRRQDVTPEGAPDALTYSMFGHCRCSLTGGAA